MVSDYVLSLFGVGVGVGLSYLLHMRCNVRATTRSTREVGRPFSVWNGQIK